MLTEIALLFALVQGPGTVVKQVNLAATPPSNLAGFGTPSAETIGCVSAFDAPPRPPEDCYPFPAIVKIMAYKPGAGYTKASLVVRVTNSGKGPVVLPVGIAPIAPRGDASNLTFSVNPENDILFVGFGIAYGDTGISASLATIRPGESIEYEIPVEIDKLKATARSPRGATVSVVVELASHKLKRRDDGGLLIITDTNPIPSRPFGIPYPK